MKRYICLLLLGVFIFNNSKAQQLPQFTQYIFNNFILNPAVAGIENYTDLKMGYRAQWSGLNGAPVTSFLSINAPIGRNFIEGDAAGFGGDNSNPSSRLYSQYYQASAPHHGIGFTMLTDKAGQITQSKFAAVYAYHLGLAPKLNLSLGVSAGLSHLTFNSADVVLSNPLDPAIANISSPWKPDISIGAWLYSGDFYAGLSVQQLLKQNVFNNSTATTEGSQTVPHFYLTGGTKFYATDDITLLPSILIKQIKPVPLTYDLNLKASFRDKFWIGGSYRHNDSFAGLVGFNLSSFINIGYSYDATTSALNTVSRGTHEIVIGIMLNNRYKVTCPQHGF
ncbi:PorP/SprF family type IX secretion system membrane protein [Mucilaginibacter antarcticus]|uniref:Type IX secretion system membrane protein PorP/SprF n=1 Tax=Mucilaginibacter antarcticus TaxID=1855725 RepID=A0ABW5XUF0_9SPHI